jgi:hypothetical protein
MEADMDAVVRGRRQICSKGSTLGRMPLVASTEIRRRGYRALIYQRTALVARREPIAVVGRVSDGLIRYPNSERISRAVRALHGKGNADVRESHGVGRMAARDREVKSGFNRIAWADWQVTLHRARYRDTGATDRWRGAGYAQGREFDVFGVAAS